MILVLINASMKSESDPAELWWIEFTYVFIYISVSLLLMLGDMQRLKKIYIQNLIGCRAH